MKKELILITLSLLCGCSTIMRDNVDTITLNSNVENVKIKIINKYGLTVAETKTPLTIPLKTCGSGYFDKEKYTVIASKEGYQTKVFYIKGRPSNWYKYGNLAFGGLIGYLLVDPLSGDMYYLNNKEPYINMTPFKQ